MSLQVCRDRRVGACWDTGSLHRFELLETHSPILVNRGFVPDPLKEPVRRVKGQIEGETVIVAHVRGRQMRSWFDGTNDIAKNIYYVRDPKELGIRQFHKVGRFAHVATSGRFYLELVEGEPPGGYPKPLAGTIKIPNRHLEYALTWYGLALTLIGVYIAFAWGRLRGGGV